MSLIRNFHLTDSTFCELRITTSSTRSTSPRPPFSPEPVHPERSEGSRRQRQHKRNPRKVRTPSGCPPHTRAARAPTPPYLVASPLAIRHQPPADPPHKRMKPERRLHQHVHHRRQIVAPTHLTPLMLNDRLDVRFRNLPAHRRRPQHQVAGLNLCALKNHTDISHAITS
jgi:hypothetical protein